VLESSSTVGTKNVNDSEASTKQKAKSKKQKLILEQRTIESIGKRLGISADNLKAWYKVTEPELLRYGGIKLGLGNRPSLRNLLRRVFPAHKWDAKKFLQFKSQRVRFSLVFSFLPPLIYFFVESVKRRRVE
jgi:hypothetical protein